MSNTGTIKTTVKKISEYTVAVLVWLLFLYTVTGYYLIPAGLHYYLTHQFAAQAKHQVVVDDIRFDPFRFDFIIEKFRINNAEGKPLIAFHYLLVDYNPATLLDKQYALELIELNKPYVQLLLDAKGNAELLALANELSGPAESTTEPASALPAVWIKQLRIVDASLDVATAQYRQALKKHITIKKLQLHDFHTTENGHANDLQITMADDEHCSINLNAKVRLDPLQLTGDIGIRNIQLQSFLTALDIVPGFTLQPLALDFATGFEMNGQTLSDIKLHNTGMELRGLSLAPHRESAPHINVPLVTVKDVQLTIKNSKDVVIKKGRINVKGMVVYKHGSEKPLVSLPRIAIKNVKLNTRKQVLNISGIDIKDGEQTVVMDKEGIINIQTLLAELLPPQPDTSPVQAASAQTASAQTANTQAASVSPPSAEALPVPGKAAPVKQPSPWHVTIENIAVKNNRVYYRSEQAAMPLDIELYPVEMTLQQLKPLEPAVPFPLQMQVSMVKGGAMQLDATVNADALAGEGKVVLKDIPLHFVQPMINDIALVDIKTGALDASIDFKANAKQVLIMKANGAVNVHNVSVYKKNSKKKVVSWHELVMQDLQFALPENRLSIKHLLIDKSYARFTLNADGTANIQELLLVKDAAVPASVAANDSVKTIVNAASNEAQVNAETGPETVVERDAHPMQFDIGLITLKDAEVGFSDLSLTPSFRVAMKQLNGDIKGISSDPASRAVVDLHGKVDRYAPVDIAGTFNVFSEKLQMDMSLAFKNIDLTTFTPYSGVYAGYAIDAGKMSLELYYNMVNDKVQGKNHIVINQLQLGKKVKSDKATSLPVKLAVALLRDEHGVIDLGFEVNGNIDDPQFSINKIFFKAIKDVLTKATKAPFKFFANLFKSKQKDVQELPFVAGNVDINPVIADKLKFVAKLMNKRQTLNLHIKGNVSPDEDTPALQEQHLINTLAMLNNTDKAALLPVAKPAQNPAIYAMLAAYYKEQRAEDIADVEERMSEELFKNGQQPDMNLIRQRSYDEAWQNLVDNTVITAADLQILATQRAVQVKQYLQEKHGINPDRVSVVENDAGAKPSLITRLGLDAETAQ